MMTTKKIKTIQVNTHSRDCHSFTFITEDNEFVDHDGYNPGVLGAGDDLWFKVDNETGQILNWKPISISDLSEGVADLFEELENEVD